MATNSSSIGDAVAKLCELCQRAAFPEDRKNFRVARDESESYLSFTGTIYSYQLYFEAKTNHELIDSCPHLLKLNNSSGSCKFCKFLRSVILSADTEDTMRAEYGISASKLKGRKVKISLNYLWGPFIQVKIDGKLKYVKAGIRGARVSLSFEGFDPPIGLIFLTEAASGNDDVKRWLSLAPPSNQSYSDSETVSWMRAYVDKAIPREYEAENDIPSRLIDVRENRTKLVLRDELCCTLKKKDPVLKYAALSYCWGSKEEARSQLKLTASNIGERMAGIEEKGMPTVLRDAVQITRALSIPFLWVDALCIKQGKQDKQDDNSDWQQECINMDKIYGNAHVTLRAASSTSCRQGFLQQRGARIRFPFESALDPRISGSYYLQFKYCYAIRGWKAPVVSELYYYDSEKCRLGQRGWPWQERVLSRRMIVFGNSNVHFVDLDTRSRNSRGTPDTWKSYHFSMSAVDSGPSESSSPETLPQLKWYSEWEDILREYSTLREHSFTYPSDALPALSGLAARYGRLLKDKYLAGHWKRFLFISLMWYFDPPLIQKCDAFDKPKSPTTYITPSWSCLCKGESSNIIKLQGFIDNEEFKSEVDAVNGEVDLAAEGNPFGAIKRAQLTISGMVFEPGRIPAASPYDIYPQAFLSSIEWTLILGPVARFTFHLDFILDTKEEVYQTISDTTWILLGSRKLSWLGSGQSRGGYGLILKKVKPTVNSRLFHRVGIFHPAGPKDTPFLHSGDNLRCLESFCKKATITVI